MLNRSMLSVMFVLFSFLSCLVACDERNGLMIDPRTNQAQTQKPVAAIREYDPENDPQWQKARQDYERRVKECRDLNCGKGKHCSADSKSCEANDPNCNGHCGIGTKCDVDNGQCVLANQ